MKHLFTLITVVCMVFVGAQTYAQICTPNTTYTSTGIYPDTMPEGNVSQPYAEDITFVMPTDTSGFNFTNFKIISISLPVGLSWVCNNDANGCNYNPQSSVYGCVHVSGTPLLAGDYNITVSVLATLEVVGDIPSTFEVFMRVNPAQTNTTNDGFSMSGFSGCSPVTVEFTNNNPGLLQYSWNFGNGNQSSSENPAPQVYTTPGDYVVNYQAWDNLTTINVYTLTGVTVNSMSGYGEGFPSYESADTYYKLFENGVLVGTSSIIADTDPAVSWTASTLLDPTKTYTIEIWDSDAGELGFGADDYMGIHTMNIGGCNGCAAGSANINYSITLQTILPVPLVVSADTIHVYGIPGVPNIYFDSINHTLHTDSISNDLQWYFEGSPIAGATTSSLVIDNSGAYSLVAISGGGCVAFSDTLDAVYCNQAVPVITQTASELSVNNVNGDLVQWYLNGTAIPNAVSNTLPITNGGNYTVVLTTSLGCEYESAVFNSTLGISVLEKKPFAIFPNPSEGIVYMKVTSQDDQFNINVRDMSGRIVKSINSKDELVGGINLSEFGKGLYLLEVNFSNAQFIERVIIK
jgi:hypothetical protein